MSSRPTATYRVQLHGGFGFDDVAAVAGYLADLGVSHVYCSPYLQAASGSAHGYDVVDHARVNTELGGEEGRDRMVAALGAAGLGHLLDVVPNHMCVADARRNAWWWDVLAHGTASPWAGWFDIDWAAPYAPREQRGRLLLPVLGDDGLDAVRLVEEDGEPLLAYHEHRFPVADGTAEPGDDPRAVHDRQHYLLAEWWRGSAHLNYRRFFDVTSLAAVRVEDARVFAATHARVLGWLTDGSVDGVRVDHPDGLADPLRYLGRLRAAAPGGYLVVEKILEPGESLPRDWPVQGTTGYDALREVGGLFLDPAGEAPLTALWEEVSGAPADWPRAVREAKHAVTATTLLAETCRLAALAAGLTGLDADDVKDAVCELLSCLPVYRTYLRPGRPVDEEQAAVVRGAVAEAKRGRPDLALALDRLARLLVAPGPGMAAELATRFQQTSGMVMAKGVEDTAFYRFHRLVSLNEVGGDPGAWGVPVEEFHAACARRQAEWPEGMTTLATHDTKRGEDVRARLAVLSELPGEWAAFARPWLAASRPPDPETGYLMLQVLVGAWPLTVERAVAYAEKASREAKRLTSWTAPDPAYDDALREWVLEVFGSRELSGRVEEFAARVAPYGFVTSLAQKLVQLTMPGVPDVYQGGELWDLSLVDPDNRRPVDYGRRRELLASLDALSPAEVLARTACGLPKLLVTSRALRLRRARPGAFRGSYTPLVAAGPKAGHLVGFVRGGEAATLAPRLVAGLGGDWAGTTVTLPAGTWRDVLTGATGPGGERPLAGLLRDFPVALLERART